MAYFSAVIARSGADWRAVDVDVEDAETLDELAELLKAARRDGPVLAVLEREDDWFALVRVDGDDDDARSFVSDLAATEGGHYGPLLAPVGDLDLVEYAHLRTPPATDGVEPEADVAPYALDDPLETDVVPAGTAPNTDAESDVDDGDEPLPDVEEPASVVAPAPWAGDPGLLDDVGVAAHELVELVDAGEGDPASVIAALGERCGFDDLLDALR
ncbi:MAG: hypothetical protein H7231_11290 [Rhodoferax sp.]|nr:hypothetical protein [Actinomycetota bacterium]